MSSNNVIELNVKAIRGEPRVDSRLIARALGIQHESLMRTLKNHQTDMERLGVFRFEIGKPKPKSTGGRPENYSLLNEDQSYFLVTLSKNTPQVVEAKFQLVMAFRRYREGKATEADYLPFYHDLHDQVKVMALTAQENGSDTPERVFHINVNKLINKIFGLESGQRPDLPPNMRVIVTTANLIARQAISEAAKNGLDHKAQYAYAKERLVIYESSVNGQRLEVAA